MASMRQVPRLFFREDFFLGDADTFRAVAAAAGAPAASPRARGGGGGEKGSSLPQPRQPQQPWNAADLVPRLSHYVDVIEVSLLGEVGR